MVKASLTDEMIQMLSEMKGKTFKSYEFNSFDRAPYVQQIIRINLGRSAINIFNEENPLPFLGTTEDLPYFVCNRTESFPYNVETKQYLINEKVKQVTIVRDFIDYKQGEYSLEIDQSIIITTDFHTYGFCRDSMISEFMKIIIDDTSKCLIEEKDIKEFISCDESEQVKVTRKIIEL